MASVTQIAMFNIFTFNILVILREKQNVHLRQRALAWLAL